MKKITFKNGSLLKCLALSVILFAFAVTAISQNVGIGVPSPTSRLDIIGTGSTSATSSFKINNSLGTSLFYVRDDGNVGINNMYPATTLDMKGIFRISGATSGFVGFQVPSSSGFVTYTLPSYDGSAGQVLTTNGMASLSWTTPSGSGGTSINCSTSSNSNYTVRGNGSGTWQCTDALQISSTGYVSINTTPSSSYDLKVNGNVGIGYSPSSSFDLSVDGNTQLDGGVVIGGSSAPSSGLYVGSSSNFYVPTSIGSSSGTTLVISSGRIYKLSSSQRYKENIKDLVFDKENFLKIRPVSFKYKSTLAAEGKNDIGVIAEEVEKLVPDLVVYEPDVMKDADGNELKDKNGNTLFSETSFHAESVKYERMSVYLIKIVADQQEEIKLLKQQVEKLGALQTKMQLQIEQLSK